MKFLSQNIIRYLFGFSGIFGAKKFLAIFFVDLAIFFMLAVSGSTLWRDFVSGFLHVLGGILMPAAFLEAVCSVLSLFVRAFRTILTLVGTKKTVETLLYDTAVALPHRSDPDRIFSEPKKLDAASVSEPLRVLKRQGIDKWKPLFLYLIILVVSICIFTVHGLAFEGLVGVLLSSAWCIFLFAKLIVGAPKLAVSETGFSYSIFGFTKYHHWVDIAGPFDVYGGGRSGFPFVGFFLYNSNKRSRSRWKGRNVYTNKLPDSFGMKQRDLAELLNHYWLTYNGTAEFRLEVELTRGVKQMSSYKTRGTGFSLIFIWLALSAVILIGYCSLIVYGHISPPLHGSKLQDYCSHHPEITNCVT